VYNSTSSTAGSTTTTITFGGWAQAVPPPPPKCSCGCAEPTGAKFADGTHWAIPCAEREQRRRAIADAKTWLAGAFCAAPDRSRLYRALAAVFHPDSNPDVDPALMVALNAARERFPG
jgi:hypothetical protein